MTSLNHNNNLSPVSLHFRTNSASGSVVSYCQSQETEIKKAKEALENVKESEKSKKEKELKKLQSGFDEHIAKDHPLDESTRKTKIDEVKKHQEFVTEFHKNFNNALKDGTDNILTHLCDGLETFLGYDKDSKGYTGQGIVYSDLDRLCDGVMGFLYQVLKDVSDKQPYSVGKDILETLINDVLKPKLSTGRKGFEVIEQVAQRVGGYNESVKNQNDLVKGKITKLESEMTTLKNQVSKVLENDAVSGTTKKSVQTVTYSEEQVKQAVMDVGQRLVECKHYANDYNYQLDMALNNTNMKNAINDLNSKLRDRVDVATKVVTHETQRLNELSDKAWTDFRNMKKCISREMQSLNESVNLLISQRIGKLLDDVNQKAANILTHLNKVRENLQDYVIKLNDWIVAARKIREAADGKVTEIVNKLQGSGGKHTAKGEVTKAAKDLQDKADELRDRAYKAKQQVQTLVREALREVKTMDDALRQNLRTVRDEIKGDLLSYVQVDLSNKIKDALKELTDPISGGADGGSLDRIVDGVKQYAEQFTENFQQTVEGWVEAIVNSEGIAQLINWYVSRNKSYSALKVSEEHTVKEIVIRHVTGTLKSLAGSSDTAMGTRNTPRENLADIKEYLNSYAKEVVNEGHAIIGLIEGDVKQNGQTQHSWGYKNDLLTKAIQTVLTAVSEAAGKMAIYFEKYSATAEISNLETAIKEVAGLGGTLHGQIQGFATGTQFGNVTTGIANRVQEKIGEDDRKNISDGLRDPDKVTLSDQFATYKSHVDTSSLPIGAKIMGNEGSLPRAIKAIETTVNGRECLENVDNGGDGNEQNKFNQKTFETLKNNIDSKLNLFTEAVEKLVKKNTGISDKDSVHAYLEDLNNMLQKGDTVTLNSDISTSHQPVKGLQKIHDDFLDMLGGGLTKAINDTEKFIQKDAPELQQNCVEAIHNHVNVYFGYTELSLTTAARRNYVSSVKQLLAAFADKVSQELKGLPAEIERDLTIGFKGFMSVFNYNLETKIVPKTDAKNMSDLSSAYKDFMWPIQDYLCEEIKRDDNENREKQNPKPNNPDKTYTNKLMAINAALTELLTYLTNNNRYGHEVYDMIDQLNQAASGLKPETFAKPSTPVLDGISRGLITFVDELKKVYINMYDGSPAIKDWLTKVTAPEENKDAVNTTDVETYKLAENGKNCAKIFLTCVSTWHDDISKLIEYCSTTSIHKKINLETDIGKWMKKCGYSVTEKDVGQEGELRNKNELHGNHVITLLTESKKLFNKYYVGTLKDLSGHLHTYYEVCHLTMHPQPRSPCNVYEILKWLCGLSYHPVNHELLLSGFSDLFDKPDEAKDSIDVEGITGTYLNAQTLKAYPQTITVATLTQSLTDVCHYSHGVLTSILGRGHADGIYAVDFNTNTDGFVYPSDMNTLICMLRDLLKQLHQQLYLLYRQCMHATPLSGWSDCWYGRGVGGSGWQCNDMKCGNQIGNQQVNQMGKQTADQIAGQTCDRHPDCGLKSPLQSFLEDGLPGFLPHRVTTRGPKMACATCPKTSGIPCKIPMGFVDISIMASHMKTGDHIKDMLAHFCGSAESPLTKLCAELSCLLPTAPKTLDDMFGFFFNYLDGWYDGNVTRQKQRETPYLKAVHEANFERTSMRLDITAMFKSSNHNAPKTSDLKSTHLTGDLYTLVKCNHTKSSAPSHPCGAYLKPLCVDTCNTFSEKHADKYLSWIVYLTETFYDLLKMLYEDCNNKCGKTQSKCYVRSCNSNCPVLQNPSESSTINHDKSCKSIVTCTSTLPTLSKHGFYYGSTKYLSGSKGQKMKRTCKDFIHQLRTVCSDKSALSQIIHETIPNYLLEIRKPFMLLTLALWLLSLLYLIHIMVIRLDLLHIKSHLHSPSSHRIAAQSLLAASRVNKLGRVFYLQP